MVVADQDVSLTITGNGDVLEPHDGIIGKKRVPASTIDDRWIAAPLPRSVLQAWWGDVRF
jgi:hypothetical protein